MYIYYIYFYFYLYFVSSIYFNSFEDIIQAVPSHRVSKPTTAHPFNVYRELRCLNPSPYMFYVDVDTFQIVGASPECLVRY